MIPIGDDNRGRRSFPIVNLSLIAINVLVFLFEVSLPPQQLERLIFAYGAIPAEIINGIDLPPATSIPISLTILTSMFLHGGWAHILGNMLFLWIFGDNVEDSMGHLKFLIFYLLGGVGAALAQVFIDTTSTVPMVGASGAISAVMAAYLVMFPNGLVQVLIILGIFPLVYMVPAVLMIGIWILLQFLNGLASFSVPTEATSGVAYFAHIGGFVPGFILVWFFRDRRAVERQRAARRGYHAFDRR